MHKLWKADLDSSFLSLRILARDGASTSPLQTVASFLELPAHEPPGSDSAGLSPIRVHGAREKCGATFAGIHIRCTVFPQREFSFAKEYFLNFIGVNERILGLEASRIIFCGYWPLLKTRAVYKYIFKRQTTSCGRKRKLTRIAREIAKR